MKDAEAMTFGQSVINLINRQKYHRQDTFGDAVSIYMELPLSGIRAIVAEQNSPLLKVLRSGRQSTFSNALFFVSNRFAVPLRSTAYYEN